MGRALRPLVTAVVATAIVGVLCLLAPISAGVRLLAGTVLAMGGASNPYGLLMDKELDGYYSATPGTAYAGYDYQAVKWSAQVVAYGFGTLYYDKSQSEGVKRIDAAIASAFDVDPDSPVVVVGYSASAGAVTKEIRALEARRNDGLPTPDPADLSFILFGNPNRPNGGLLNRLPGLYIPPPLGVTFDGPTPVTEYQTLDISWEYDPISDFPAQPFNVLADLNALAAFLTRHSDYYNADPTDASSYVADVTVGDTRYLTLRRDHLPLLELLYQWTPFLAPVLDAVEPAMKSVIDRAYDRAVSPAVSTPLQWGPVSSDGTQAGAQVSVSAPIASPPKIRPAKPPTGAKPPLAARSPVVGRHSAERGAEPATGQGREHSAARHAA